jgi:hypothetical protein
MVKKQASALARIPSWTLPMSSLVGVVALVATLEFAIPAFPLATGLAAIAAAAGSAAVATTVTRLPKAPSDTGPRNDVDQLPRPLEPYGVSVAGSKGECPLGLQVGHNWEIDPLGGTSRPMCKAAAIAAARLTSTWTEAVSEPDPGRVARCKCPWVEAGLTFKASTFARSG